MKKVQNILFRFLSESWSTPFISIQIHTYLHIYICIYVQEFSVNLCVYINIYAEFTGGQQICWCDLNLECHHRHYYRNHRRPQPTKITASIRAAVDDYCLPSSFLIWLPSFWPSYLVRNLLEPQEKVVNIHWPGLRHMIWKIVVRNSRQSILFSFICYFGRNQTKSNQKQKEKLCVSKVWRSMWIWILEAPFCS